VVGDNVCEFIERADLTEDDRHAIGHGNAETLMRIPT
jgi:predicted TIM-barrel fold metal-dependent hydrolase